MNWLKRLIQLFVRERESGQEDIEGEYPNIDAALVTARELEDCRQRARFAALDLPLAAI